MGLDAQGSSCAAAGGRGKVRSVRDHVVESAHLISELEDLRTPNAELEARLATHAVTEREVSEHLQQRTAELAIVNSVQHALAEQLDMQAIVDVVGDQIRDIFATQATYIALLDRETNLIRMPYFRQDDHRIVIEPMLLGTSLTSIVLQSRQPLLLGTLQELEERGAVQRGEPSHSYLGVPLISINSSISVISL